MKQELLLKERALEKYNQGVYVSQVYDDKEKGNCVAVLDAVVPRVILDDQNDMRYVKFLKLRNLGRIAINKQDKFVSETKPEEVINRMEEGVKEIRLRTEQIVLGSIYDKLSEIAMIRTILNPIYSILKSVYEGGFDKAEFSRMSVKKRDKYVKYMNFLSELGIIREQTDKYSEGNHFIEIRKALEKSDEKIVLNKVFGLAIRDGRPYLLNNLNFYVLKPFIRISNVYYLFSALANKTLSMKKETLYSKYNETYQIRADFRKFGDHIDQLSRAGILEEDSYITGKQDIFEAIMTKFRAVSSV